jgi:hypothetical protein
MLSDDEKRKLAEMMAKTIVNKIGNRDSGIISIDGDDLVEAIQQGGDPDTSASKQDPVIQESVLVDMFAHVMKPCQFKPGDRVRQTKGSEFYRWPQPNQLAVVLEVYPDAKWAIGKEDSTKVSKEDMLILVLGAGPTSKGREEKWLTYYVESWRFEKYESQAVKH